MTVFNYLICNFKYILLTNILTFKMTGEIDTLIKHKKEIIFEYLSI